MKCIQFLVLFLFLNHIYSASIDGVRIKQVIDGQVILVEASLGGTKVLYPVRLMYIRSAERLLGDSAESAAQARSILQQWAQPGQMISIWSPHEEFSYDAGGRLLGVAWPIDSVNDIVPGQTIAIQENLLASGCAVLIKEHGELPEIYSISEYWPDTQNVAHKAMHGMWKSPLHWMK